jgi:hypothetical protein
MNTIENTIANTIANIIDINNLNVVYLLLSKNNNK